MKRLRGKDASGLVLLRADSAFYGHPVVAAAHRAGAKVSITARMDPAVKRAIATINEKAWTTIQYTDAVRDDTTGAWISSPKPPSPPSWAERKPNASTVAWSCAGSRN